MLRHALAIVSLLALGAVTFIGCGSGYDESEAKTVCDQDRKNIVTCGNDDAMFSSCTSCYQDCGADCSLVPGTCTYACPK